MTIAAHYFTFMFMDLLCCCCCTKECFNLHTLFGITEDFTAQLAINQRKYGVECLFSMNMNMEIVLKWSTLLINGKCDVIWQEKFSKKFLKSLKKTFFWPSLAAQQHTKSSFILLLFIFCWLLFVRGNDLETWNILQTN